MHRALIAIAAAALALVAADFSHAGAMSTNSRTSSIGILKGFKNGDIAVWRVNSGTTWTDNAICAGLGAPDAYNRALLPASNTLAFDVLKDLLLLAKSSGRQVRFFLQGCALSQGKYYPVIDSVQIDR